MAPVLNMQSHYHAAFYYDHSPSYEDSRRPPTPTRTRGEEKLARPLYDDSRRPPTPRTGGEEKIALPSIRQAFPDFDSEGCQLDAEVRKRPLPHTPLTGGQYNEEVTSPHYTVSPHTQKRRRLSCHLGDDSDRTSPVPRVYTVPQQFVSQPRSPIRGYLPLRQWSGEPPRAYANANTELHRPTHLPPNIKTEPVETRPMLPSLPPLKLEPGTSSNFRTHDYASDDYIPDRRSRLPPSDGRWIEAGGHGYGPPTYDYNSSHHPNRAQSLSVGSAHLDRTPFSAGPYPRFQEPYMRVTDMVMGANGDVKQRKRRGNLPKETTDKLRAWFVAHLSHPYPKEDEKQELMRETGLQMNQISNWFINARRRQLPTMINNALTTSDVMNSRVTDNNTLSPREIEYDGNHQSESEASTCEDRELERARQQVTNRKRGSI
ncbi:hypothetical protein F4825DRAFT_362807 [Nemania diffusa]|nr:hypothetical protein F4825DRAFT_362807 [Nemania diffusa]